MNRSIVLFFIVLLTPLFAKAQTAGQVMFVGFNVDGNDGFSFVTFVDIANGTNIRFNDNEWNGTVFDADGTDGSMTWNNNTGGIISAGTVITINNSRTAPSATAGAVSGGTIDLNATDEVLYMFLGTTASLPITFLSAIATETYAAAVGTITNTGLADGVSAVHFIADEDVMVYTGSTNCNSTIVACAAAVANTANWATQGTAGDDSNNGFPDFPANVTCGFFGVAMYPAVTYYSRASGAWDINTSWSLSSDGSTGAVAVGTWPRRTDNVVIRSGHTITINAVDDNKSCGISPDGLGRANVSSVGNPFPNSNISMFYHTGDISVSGTFTVNAISIMLEGYTHLTSTGTFTLVNTLVNLGHMEADASATWNGFDKLVLAGNSTTIINTTSSTLTDDLIISYLNATLCGAGITTLQNGAGSNVDLRNGATVAQICTSFRVECSGSAGGGCGNSATVFPLTGSTVMLLGNTGPGGIGNSTNNKLWVRAHDLNLANNASVPSWADISGNSLTAVNATAGQQPTFNTNIVNGFPALNFDGGDYLNLGTPAGLNLIPGTNSWSFFCVYNVASGNEGTLFSKATVTDASRQYQYTFDTNTLTSFIGGTYNLGTVNSSNAWSVGTYTNNNTTASSWSNESPNITGQAIGTGVTTGTSVLIGARRDATATDFGFPLTGRISEIAVYNALVNTAQRIIIDNYLSAKYATTLTANNVYTRDNGVAPDNFDYEVAGIGQAADGTSQKDAKGSGVVRMWNANGLGNNEFLMWGHNNAILNSSTTTGVGAPIQERLVRIWSVSELNVTGGIVDVGTVSVSFDISALSGSVIPSSIRLLIDRDNDGFNDNDVTPVEGSYVNNTIVFSGVNFVDGDRFTLGNIDPTRSLPVELTKFSATPENHTVQVNWTTASETDNDFFTVERSKNAQQWEIVKVVPGAGTSKVKNHYETVDDGPYTGTSYYRLKQTDFDKTVTHSELVRVVLDYETPITLYPNPFSNNFRIVAEFEIDPNQVKLYNSSGIEMAIAVKKDGQQVIADPGAIPPGMYFLKITDGFVSKTIKIVKKHSD